MPKIAIFPASGKLASSTIAHLSRLIPPSDLILISRHPEKQPSACTDAGVTTRRADYDDPTSFEGVFDGVDYLVLVSYPSIEVGKRVEAHKHAITAAQTSNPGISHIFYTSLAFGGDCTPNSVAHVMQAHLATEAYLASLASNSTAVKPFTYTAIREGIYAESFPMYTGFFNLKSPQAEVKIPHDGSGPGVAWAKIDDLGEGTARLIQRYVDSPDGSPYNNRVVLLSGPKVWSLADTLRITGEAVGKRDVKIKEVGVEEFASEALVRDSLGSHGPGEVPRQWATSFEAVRKGETSVVSGELARLLGREPEGFEEIVKRIAEV